MDNSVAKTLELQRDKFYFSSLDLSNPTLSTPVPQTKPPAASPLTFHVAILYGPFPTTSDQFQAKLKPLVDYKPTLLIACGPIISATAKTDQLFSAIHGKMETLILRTVAAVLPSVKTIHLVPSPDDVMSVPGFPQSWASGLPALPETKTSSLRLIREQNPLELELAENTSICVTTIPLDKDALIPIVSRMSVLPTKDCSNFLLRHPKSRAAGAHRLMAPPALVTCLARDSVPSVTASKTNQYAGQLAMATPKSVMVARFTLPRNDVQVCFLLQD